MEKVQVLNQLSKILETESFLKSKILSKFLTFITVETLNGNEQNLKEYVIALSVLNKAADWSPQNDAVVRIHALRLRKNLDDYYSSKGALDDIRINIPKGRYIPVFSKNGAKSKPGTLGPVESSDNAKPVLGIFPLELIQENDRLEVLSSMIVYELNVGLTKFVDIEVISANTIQNALDEKLRQEDVISKYGIDYEITGSCHLIAKSTRINIELYRLSDNQVIWAESYIIENIYDDLLVFSKEITHKVVAMTCGHFGVIDRDVLSSEMPAGFSYLNAIDAHKKYHQKFTEEAFIETLKVIEYGIKENPENALLISFKAELILNLISMDVREKEEALSIGFKLVNRAISLDQNCQHAYQVRAWANLLQHDLQAFHRSIDKMLSINPHDAMYIGTAGFGYMCVGEYEKGLDFMSTAIDLNPYYNWHLNIGFCFYSLVHKEYEEALYWAEMIGRKGFLWDALLQVCALGLLNRKEEAFIIKSELLMLSPDFPKRARTIVDAFIFDRKLQQTIIQGLISAGIKIPNSSGTISTSLPI